MGAPTPLRSWLGVGSYCTPDASLADGYTCAPPASIYCAALYWAVVTCTSVGYGDIVATPTNALEQSVATAIILLAALIWAQVSGTISLAPSPWHQ